MLSTLFPIALEFIIPAAVTVLGANVVTASTPSRVDNELGNALLVIINFISFNFGKNKNADVEK